MRTEAGRDPKESLSLWLTAVLLLANVVAASGQSPSAEQAKATLIGPATAACDTLDLCATPQHGPTVRTYQLASDEAPAQSKQALTRFTRLAGKFMGRVDMAQTGKWRLRFVLDIR